MLILLACLCAASNFEAASGGVIFVAGDINIAHPIDGSRSVVTPGNARLFQNIRGTSRNVLITDESFRNSGAVDAVNAIHTLYNNTPGVTSTLDLSKPLINDTILSGIDLFVSFLPDDEYQQSELDSIARFLHANGDLFIIADIGGFGFDRNLRTNRALERLGSTLRLDNIRLDSPFRLTTNIDTDPFTDGVDSVRYSRVTSISGGTSLIRTTEGETFVAYERIGLAVPEPASLATWAMFTGSMTGLRQRRSK